MFTKKLSKIEVECGLIRFGADNRDMFPANGETVRFIDNNGGRLSVEQTLSMMEPVISSMEEIHKAGLIHRDISPENIMLDSDGSIKVIDFGATKKLSNRTAQVYYGKFGYAPLEQSLGEGQGPWTDVYGICATMYCMITPDEESQKILNDVAEAKQRFDSAPAEEG